MNTRPSLPRQRGFSLLELLIVLGIMVLVATFVVPAVGQMIRGTPITVASQMLTAEMAFARQSAMTHNRSVEVRIIRFGDPESPGEDRTSPNSGHFRALQLMEISDSGYALALDQVKILPNPAIISNDPKLSSILDTNETAGKQPRVMKTPNQSLDPRMPRGVDFNYQYMSFRFLPNGATDLTATDPWFLTVHGLKEPLVNQVPINFFTLQVDGASGGTRGFRPSL